MKTKFLIQNNISLRNIKSCESINELYDFLDGKNADHIRIVAFELIAFRDGTTSNGDIIFNKMFSFFKGKDDMEKLLKTNIHTLELERE